ncbi:hypothetical protein KKC59_01435 [bacterium]|nr:hypothetical protein [bacterium]
MIPKDEGRRTRDEGRRTRDEGRRTRDEGRIFVYVFDFSSFVPRPSSFGKREVL